MFSRKKFLYITVFIVSALLIFSSLASAKDISFEATVDRNKVTLGKALQLNLKFDGIQNVPALELSDIDGFESRYLGPLTRMSVTNGRMSTSVTHMYTLIPLKVGTFQIGPFSFAYRGDKYLSNPISIEIVEGPVQEEKRPYVSFDESQSLKDRIFLSMETEKQTAYINEMIPVTIRLYYRNLTIRDIQYPEFSQEGFSVSEFEKPAQYREVVRGVFFDVIEFKTYIFATRTGEFALNPARLKCNLLVKKKRRRRSIFGDDMFEGFFGGYDIYPLELKSEGLPIAVVSLPQSGKPPEFNGAVGRFTFDAQASPRTVKVGDPITLKMTISGEGNFNTVLQPKLDVGKGFKIYEPQIAQEKGAKIFEQVLIPTKPTVKEIPPITFAFFDPNIGVYRTRTTSPIPIEVVKSKDGEKLEIVEISKTTGLLRREELGRDIIYIKDSPGRIKKKDVCLFKNRIFLSLHAFALLFAMSVYIFHRRKERLTKDLRYARRLRAPKKARSSLKAATKLLNEQKTDKFYDLIFKMLQEYFGDKFHIATQGITVDIAEQLLKPKGASGEILDTLKSVFEECDRARYAAHTFDETKMKETLRKTRIVIDYFETS